MSTTYMNRPTTTTTNISSSSSRRRRIDLQSAYAIASRALRVPLHCEQPNI